MILLIDIGNTHTHLGLGTDRQVVKQTNIATAKLSSAEAGRRWRSFVGGARVEAAVLCSVVPVATPAARRWLSHFWKIKPLELSYRTVRGIGIDYPRPATIGADRLANAVAVRHHYGAPSVVVDFGTAVTFDVVDRRGNYVGGIIAPGLSMMTNYLAEKTALLPRIRIRDVRTVIGKNTEQAMLVGALYGYPGLVRGLATELKAALKTRKLPLVATGGYAELMASKLPEITAVEPLLTLEGLRLVWAMGQAEN